MEGFCNVLLFMSFVVGAYFQPDQNSEITSLRNEVAQLKQFLTSLQSQAQAQEQKYAAVLSSVLSSLASLRVEENSTVLKFKNLKDQLNVSHVDLELANTQLTISYTNLTSRMSVAEQKIGTLQSELSTIRTNFGNLETGFEVLLDQSCTIKENDTLKFDTVKLNIGGYYNAMSGVFTAPVLGTYLFWANVLLKGVDNVLYTDIISARGRLARGYASVTKDMPYGTAASTVIAQLNKGEQVWFGASATPGTAQILGIQHSSYGGILLQLINRHN